MKEEMWL